MRWFSILDGWNDDWRYQEIGDALLHNGSRLVIRMEKTEGTDLKTAGQFIWYVETYYEVR